MILIKEIKNETVNRVIYSREILESLIKAKKLAYDLNHTFIETLHILASICSFPNVFTSFVGIRDINLTKKFLAQLNITSSKDLKQNRQLEPEFSLLSLTILSKLNANKIINTLDFVAIIFKFADNSTNKFIKLLGLSNFFNLDNFNLSCKHPEFLNQYGIYLEDTIEPNFKLIGRKKELNTLIEILLRNISNNAILIGDFSSGRNSIIKELFMRIKFQQVPTKLQNKKIWGLNINKLVKNFEQDPEKVTYLIKSLYDLPNVIFICDQMNLLFEHNDSTQNIPTNFYLSSLFKELITLNKVQFIGISNRKEFDKEFKSNTFITNYFNSIGLSELEEFNTLKLLQHQASKFEQYHNVSIQPEILKYTIELSKTYLKTKPFPSNVLELLDLACVKSSIETESFIHKNITTKTPVINKYNQAANILINDVKKNNLREALSNLTKLPQSVINSQIKNSLNSKAIETQLSNVVFGQEEAIIKIANALKKTQSGLKQENKPIGSWIFCGPSGTGKTELAKTIALLLFGSSKELIRFDMSEFMEKHSISRLIGAPPGYVGYGEGGQLTEAVKNKPYSVILFDEIEKAHPDVNNIMLQLLDDGCLTDSLGNHIDFSNTIIIFTSNLGCPKTSDEMEIFNTSSKSYLENKIISSIQTYFKPEFINRLNDFIIFNPLKIETLTLVLDKFLSQLITRIKKNDLSLGVFLSSEFKTTLINSSYKPLYGARPLHRMLENFVEKPISEILMGISLKVPCLFSFFIDSLTSSIYYTLKLR